MPLGEGVGHSAGNGSSTRLLPSAWLCLGKLPPDAPGALEAAALRKRLFPGGLAFLKLPFKLEWSESQTRLDLIEANGLGPSIDQLAGKQFLAEIREAHQSYGAALGMSKPVTPAASPAQVRGALDAFSEAVRTYVVKVIAHIDDEAPATKAAADALLAPLAQWTTPARRAPDPADGESTGAPTEPVVPPT